MTNKLVIVCPNCGGCGWVCEEHGDHPSDVESIAPNACDGGAGMPCLDCHPNGRPPNDLAPADVHCATPEAWTQILEVQFRRS